MRMRRLRRKGCGSSSRRTRHVHPSHRVLHRVPRSGICGRLLPLLGLAPALAAQDASIPTSGAEDFLGEWHVTFPQPEGPISIVLSIVDDGGQVVGDVIDPSERFILIEEIMMSGPELLLGFRMEFEGQKAQVMIYLFPDEEGLAVRLEGGGGAFTATGRGRRADPGSPNAG